MPSLTIEITPETAKRLEDSLRNGEFVDADDAVNRALNSILDPGYTDSGLRELQALIDEAEADFRNGDFITLNSPEDIDKFTSGILQEVLKGNDAED